MPLNQIIITSGFQVFGLVPPTETDSILGTLKLYVITGWKADQRLWQYNRKIHK